MTPRERIKRAAIAAQVTRSSGWPTRSQIDRSQLFDTRAEVGFVAVATPLAVLRLIEELERLENKP